jgi:hypothetical protein
MLYEQHLNLPTQPCVAFKNLKYCSIAPLTNFILCVTVQAPRIGIHEDTHYAAKDGRTSYQVCGNEHTLYKALLSMEN